MWLKSTIPVEQPKAQPGGDGEAHAAAVCGFGLCVLVVLAVLVAVAGTLRRPAAPASQAPRQRGDAEQQRGQQLHAQSLARQRPDACEQARGRGRDDRDVVAL